MARYSRLESLSLAASLNRLVRDDRSFLLRPILHTLVFGFEIYSIVNGVKKPSNKKEKKGSRTKWIVLSTRTERSFRYGTLQRCECNRTERIVDTRTERSLQHSQCNEQSFLMARNVRR